MSRLTPETPSRPDWRLTKFATSAADRFFPKSRCVRTPGHRSPERVPIMRPPFGTNPIVVSMLRPPRIAAMLAVLPKWAITIRPSAALAPDPAPSCCRRDSWDSPWKRGHLPMEGRVEAGNVQQLGKRILNHSHRPNLRREMPGIQLPDLAKLLLDHGRYHHGLGEAAAAMDNPMADSIDAVAE